MPPIRVGIAGAHGRMGTIARETVSQAAGMVYAGGLSRRADPDNDIVDRAEELFARGVDVLLDLTTHPPTVGIAHAAVAAGVRPVIGATGWSADEREALAQAVERAGTAAMLVPNFSVGAALMLRFAQAAARYFPSAEIIELHHDQKRDAPSGTARLTAERITLGRGKRDGDAVPIHSVRMRGLLAHQEVLFGNTGELLTIRHDSFSRESFAAGMIACVRRVCEIRGLEVGLDGAIDAVEGASSLA